MSIQAFSQLSQEEIDQLVQAPAKIALLIAAADQDIDEKETEWAKKLVHYRSFSSEPLLFKYYEMVDQDFENHLTQLEAAYADQPGQLVPQLSEQLAALNPILQKVAATDPDYAQALRKSWRSLAKRVAEASGGLLGFASINKEEEKLIDLPMIQED